MTCPAVQVQSWFGNLDSAVETCANCDKFRDYRLITHGNIDIFRIDPEAAARPGRLDARKNGSSRREEPSSYDFRPAGNAQLG
jgi:hypothetical protein